MAIYTISIDNETFSSSDKHEGHSLDTATAQALEGALRIGAEEVVRGEKFFAAEVKVETEDQLVRRFVVSIGASPLQILNKRTTLVAS